MPVKKKSMPNYPFELNCYMTKADLDLSQVQFKELELGEEHDYNKLRRVLRNADSIWHAMGRAIYLIGDERELRATLTENKIESRSARLIPYDEMLSRETSLRFLLYSALDRFMKQHGFLPSLGRSDHAYYPAFDAKDGVIVTRKLEKKESRVIAKDGVVFDFNFSPQGPALLWIDTKLFTFVHSADASFEAGEPVYLMCETARECCSEEHNSLLDGAFVLEGNENDLPSLSCIKPNMANTLAVQSKSHEDTIRIPYSCAYTTVDTATIKGLGIYEWWFTQAIPRSSNRYTLTRKLVRLLVGKDEILSIPLPDNQQIGFDLHPITTNVQVRFAQ